MREIAKECGCSLATVSYALNHAGGTKISSATRLRIIDTAKQLNYPTTRTTRGKKNRAAILVTRLHGESVGRRLHLTDLAMQLEAQLLELGIPSVILRLGDLVEDWRKILAVSPSVIFVLDGGCRAVAHVNPPCVTPMIFVDCDNDDPLYYKILPDYPSLMGEAKTLFVAASFIWELISTFYFDSWAKTAAVPHIPQSEPGPPSPAPGRTGAGILSPTG